MKVLVTGSNGFIGAALVASLVAEGHTVLPIVRKATRTGEIAIGDIATFHNWAGMLEGVDAVMHLAGDAHNLRTKPGQEERYRRINTDATLLLARAAQQAGVKRFIFMSSIAVERQNAYGLSKWRAEEGLCAMMLGGMEIVIIRPPLVYGPGVRANFLRFMKLAASGLPLPLGGLRTRRSMVYIGNLVDALKRCLTHPAAVNQTYQVADTEALSIPDLLRILAQMLQRPIRLVPVPQWSLRLLGKLLGKTQDIERLTESLVIDTSKIRAELGWMPPFTLKQGLEETARWYQSTKT